VTEMIGNLLRQRQRTDRRARQLSVQHFPPKRALGGTPSMRAFANAAGKLSTKNKLDAER